MIDWNQALFFGLVGAVIGGVVAAVLSLVGFIVKRIQGDKTEDDKK